MIEDRLLIRRFNAGDMDALCRIYEKYRQDLLSVAMYEAELVISDLHITFLTGGKPVEVKVIGDEFQWDGELEPDMFEPNIPSDYTPMEFKLRCGLLLITESKIRRTRNILAL